MCFSLTALVRLVPFQKMTAPSSKPSLATCIRKYSFGEMHSDSVNTGFGADLKQFNIHFLTSKRKIRLGLLEAPLYSNNSVHSGQM